MRAYSQDLRERVLNALEHHERPTSIARRLEVSRDWVYEVKLRYESTGERSARRQGGYRRSRIAHLEEAIREWIKAQPDLTLAQQGITLRDPALWHQLHKWGLRFKKTLHASEQAREDMQQARSEWQGSQPALAQKHLVFVDETATSTGMTPTRGWAPRGERCVASAPHGHWKTTTFIAALRHDRLTAPMVLDGPMNGASFLAWVQQFLCPTLRTGDIVIADNLSSHKVAGVRQAIETVGTSLRYLPPDSPDLNPPEKAFAKLKTLLRRAAARTVDALWERIGSLVDAFPAGECGNYFAASGYGGIKSKML